MVSEKRGEPVDRINHKVHQEVWSVMNECQNLYVNVGHAIFQSNGFCSLSWFLLNVTVLWLYNLTFLCLPSEQCVKLNWENSKILATMSYSFSLSVPKKMTFRLLAYIIVGQKGKWKSPFCVTTVAGFQQKDLCW